MVAELEPQLRVDPDPDRVALTRSVEELYTFSPFINRTRRRDIGEFTIRDPQTVPIDFTPDQQRLHDGLLGVIGRILARCHGQQNVKFMMTTVRRQAASCLYGLAPMLGDILTGKLDRLELWETSDDMPGDPGVMTALLSSHDGAALMSLPDLVDRVVALMPQIECWAKNPR